MQSRINYNELTLPSFIEECKNDSSISKDDVETYCSYHKINLLVIDPNIISFDRQLEGQEFYTKSIEVRDKGREVISRMEGETDMDEGETFASLWEEKDKLKVKHKKILYQAIVRKNLPAITEDILSAAMHEILDNSLSKQLGQMQSLEARLLAMTQTFGSLSSIHVAQIFCIFIDILDEKNNRNVSFLDSYKQELKSNDPNKIAATAMFSNVFIHSKSENEHAKSTLPDTIKKYIQYAERAIGQVEEEKDNWNAYTQTVILNLYNEFFPSKADVRLIIDNMKAELSKFKEKYVIKNSNHNFV